MEFWIAARDCRLQLTLELNTLSACLSLSLLGSCVDVLINPLRPKSHYSGFVIIHQYKNYDFRVLWPMNLE